MHVRHKTCDWQNFLIRPATTSKFIIYILHTIYFVCISKTKCKFYFIELISPFRNVVGGGRDVSNVKKWPHDL